MVEFDARYINTCLLKTAFGQDGFRWTVEDAIDAIHIVREEGGALDSQLTDNKVASRIRRELSLPITSRETLFLRASYKLDQEAWDKFAPQPNVQVTPK